MNTGCRLVDEPLITGAQPKTKTRDWLLDSHAILQHKYSSWRSFLGKARAPGPQGSIDSCLRILDRPTEHVAERTRQIYRPHISTNTGTAAYADIKSWFSAVLAYLAVLNISVILLAGDQQTFVLLLLCHLLFPHLLPLLLLILLLQPKAACPTYPTCPMPSRRHLLIVYSHLLTLICDLTFDNRFSRMLWLKRMDEPGEYKAIVPGLGHFHSAIHMLMAIHKLWCVTTCRILGLYRFDLLSLFKNTDFSICDQVECSCQSPA